MRLNLLIAVFTLTITGANAGHDHSSLALRMQDQSLFLATIDNFCHEVPQRVMTFEDLSPGSHHLYATKVRLNRWGRIIYKEIVFDGMIHIPGGSDLEAVITRFGEFRIKRVHPIAPVAIQQPFYDPYSTPVQCGPAAMHEHDFRMLVHTIENASFDRTRLNIALYAVDQNHFTTAQVSMLMSLMTFESTKLTLAKRAFSKTLDPQVYYAVYQQFTFESSIRELNNYIGWG